MENMTVIKTPVDHEANLLQNTHKQLATQLQQIQVMMQAMQMRYSAGLHNVHKYYGGSGYHSGHTNYRGQGGRGVQLRGNWQGVPVGRVNRDLTNCCWTHGMCSHPRITAGHRKNYTRSTNCGATRCREARGTAPDMSGQYLQVKLM